MPADKSRQAYADLVASQALATVPPVNVPVEFTPTLHPDVGHWQGLDCTPASADVPAIWVRHPKSGIASKVPLAYPDTIKRVLSEGFELIDDPTTTPGVPIFGQPAKTTPRDALRDAQGGGFREGDGGAHIYRG